MNFKQRIPIRIPHKVSETSPLSSPRESNNPFHIWKQHNSVQENAGSLQDNAALLQRNLHSIRQPTVQFATFHPFKIYQYPTIFRTSSSLDTDKNWRQIRVRNGAVLTDYSDGPNTIVKGTDGYTYVDYNLYPTETPVTGSDILVPVSTHRYFIWIQNAGTADYSIKYGTDPTVNGWASFPQNDGNNFIIGYCDTLTSGSIHRMYVRQYLRTDLTAGSGTSGSNIRWWT